MHLALVTALALLSGCSTSDNGDAAPPAVPPPVATAETAYTCPMHPSVHAEAPGNCPICGMDLVPAKPGAQPAAVAATPATAAPLEAHDHRSLHDGEVSMYGDHHVEYVGARDEYRFWVTNAKREPITTGVSGSVKDGESTIPLTADNATGLLSGHGVGAGTRAVMVDVTADGATFSLGFNAMPAAGTGEAHGHHHEGE